MIAEVASQNIASVKLSEYIQKIGITLDNHGRPLRFAVIHENIYLKGKKWVSTNHHLIDRPPQRRVFRLFGLFEEF